MKAAGSFQIQVAAERNKHGMHGPDIRFMLPFMSPKGVLRGVCFIVGQVWYTCVGGRFVAENVEEKT